MANDKDFLLKNAVEVGGPTKVTLGTVTSNNIDLATGNYFADTPSGASTYTISNAGDVQSFQLEVTGGTAEVAQNFSTTLYTGNGSTQTITNGIDLSGDGGLVWVKDRDSGTSHILSDTERGSNNGLASDLTNGTLPSSYGQISGFNSSGFSVNYPQLYAGETNASGDNYVSWTFKKEPSFFDIVTYTGDGVAGREIAHNLGSTPAVIITKNLNDTENWQVYHKDLGNDQRILLNQTAASGSAPTHWNSTTPTDTVFTVGTHNGTNGSGDGIVAYLFAHDDAADGLIQCGSYTGNGSTDGPEINLGWQPQWLLIKGTSSGNDWNLLDNKRGTINKHLYANDSAIEYDTDAIEATDTGFKLVQSYGAWNASGDTYIYMAIRAASDLDITWPSSIEWTGGSAPSSPATGETDVFTLSTDDGGTTYTGIKSIDNAS